MTTKSLVDIGLYGDHMVMNFMEPGPPYEICSTHHTVFLYEIKTFEELNEIIKNLQDLKSQVGA